MAKKDNQNNAADYLAQVERDGRQIQSQTGLPWHKGSKLKHKKGSPSQNINSNQNSLITKTLLAIGYVVFGYLLYMANPNFLIVWIVFGMVFLLMIRDASKKSKDDK